MATLRDVADRAKVSITTASKIINRSRGDARFSPECITRVRAAATELGYQGNYHFRSVRLGRSEMIGMVVDAPEARDGRPGWYRVQVMGGVGFICQKAAHELMMVLSNRGESALARGLKHLHQHRIDGLVVFSRPGVASRPHPNLAGVDLPVVLCDYPHPTHLPVVSSDDAAGVVMAVEHLRDLGHRDVLWLSPSWPDNPAVDRRKRAFAAAAMEAGMNGAMCLFDAPTYDEDVVAMEQAAQQALAEQLAGGTTFTAIACFSEITAFAAYGAVAAAGLRVPDDVSVIGLGDVPYATRQTLPMTTIDTRPYELGRRATQLLMEMTAGPDALKKHQGYRELVTPELVIRQSTAPPRP